MSLPKYMDQDVLLQWSEDLDVTELKILFKLLSRNSRESLMKWIVRIINDRQQFEFSFEEGV